MVNSNQRRRRPTLGSLEPGEFFEQRQQYRESSEQVSRLQNLEGVAGLGTVTEERIREIFRDEFERYYRRKYPTFEITGGGPTAKHEPSEFCLTTNNKQILHFYEGGIAKMRAGKNFEIYSGDDASVGDGKVTGEGGHAFMVYCKHGRIVLKALSSDIEINGRNVNIKAQKNIYVTAGDNIRLRSGSQTDILAGADMNLDANRELFINGGAAVGIHCEGGPIETTSGVDLILAPEFFEEISGFYGGIPINKIDKFNDPFGGLDPDDPDTTQNRGG